jgi:hypothetical protein
MSPPYAGEVVELSLLLSAGQAADLEEAAFQRGATAGELVRRLVREFLKAEKKAASSDPQ